MDEWTRLENLSGFRHETQYPKLADSDKRIAVYERCWWYLIAVRILLREDVFPGTCTFLKKETETYQEQVKALAALDWEEIKEQALQLIWHESAMKCDIPDWELPFRADIIIDKVMTLTLDEAISDRELLIALGLNDG